VAIILIKKLKYWPFSRKRTPGALKENDFSLGKGVVRRGGNPIPLYLQYFFKNPTPLMILYSV